MATIEKTKTGYRAKIYIGKIDGKTRFESITAKTKAEVRAKAAKREAQKSGKNYPHKTLADACARYTAEVSPTHKGERWEIFRAKSIAAHRIGAIPMSKLATPDIASWRDDRLKTVAPATILREINLLNSIIEAARRDWGWIGENPLKGLRKPRAPQGRRRRVSEDEIAKLVSVSGYAGGVPQNATQLTVLAFLFAIETAMRSGEILGLTWDAVHPRYVSLPKTKNGESREVPLSPRAKEIIELVKGFERPFPVATRTRDALFRKVLARTDIVNLHYHDSRAEAIFRLSKKLDVLELARVIGHRDINSLRHYYHATADELADKLR